MTIMVEAGSAPELGEALLDARGAGEPSSRLDGPAASVEVRRPARRKREAHGENVPGGPRPGRAGSRQWGNGAMGLRWILLGFAAGLLAVPLFHQAALFLLHAAGIGPAAWNMAPVPPFGVPALLSAAFWGGLWGIALALVERRFPRGAGYWVAALLFGA